MSSSSQNKRTASEAGWRLSRYNLSVKLPEKDNAVIANLYSGTCGEYGPVDLFLMSSLDKISEDHPIIPRLAKRGVIVNFDERAALDTRGRISCSSGSVVSLMICPTLGCNFDCPYCFENHHSGKMTPDIQNDVISLAQRMMKAGRPEKLSVSWYGGEPLLAPDVIRSLSAKLIALAKEYQAEYKAEIITNGYLLTPENVKMLKAANISKAQISIDGIGADHDATRHLADGKPTFERIADNLRQPLPFKVTIRHNVHRENRDKIEKLSSFIDNLSEESGNSFRYRPALVFDSDAANRRGSTIDLVDRPLDWIDDLTLENQKLSHKPGVICDAHLLFYVTIDEKGRLYKCPAAVSDPKLSFGNARDWDPKDPLITASNPDMAVMFLNTAYPVPDVECRECIWLPACGGGCAYQRLFHKKNCVPYRNDPEAYVRRLLKELEQRSQSFGEKSPGF